MVETKPKKAKATQIITDPTDGHIKKLICLSILSKIALTIFVIATKTIFDIFAIEYYYTHINMLFEGVYPYINYSYEYPILSWIPSLIAYIPAYLLNNDIIFIFAFIGLMVLADIITVICIYKIALTIWGSNKKALIAGILYATAVQVIYVTLTEYTAFCTMLLAVGLYFTIVKKDTMKGYAGITAGFFTKAFPIITLPFIVLYNSKKTALKTELISACKIFGSVALGLFVPFYLYNPATLDTYLFKLNGDARGVFSSSVTYLTNAWTQGVFGLPITTETISAFFLVILGIVMALLLYVGYKAKTQDPKLLLKLILVATFAVVTVMRFHSPNYDCFYAIPLCILAVDDIRSVILFYASQVTAYIVFPVSFWSLWTNPTYTGAIGTQVWWMAVVLFTAQLVILITLIYYVVKPKEILSVLRA